MPDIADAAGKFIMEESDRRLNRIRSAIPAGPGAEECEDCGEPIPEARRKAMPGCTRCISCQESLERSGA